MVRDQCWINEILLGASWERGRHLVRDRNEEQATVDTIDFETLLSGTFYPLSSCSTPQTEASLGIYTPTSLPVQLSLGAQFPSTALVLTFPLPLPSSPLGRATVTHSIASVKGVVVELEGIDDPMGMNAGPGLSLKERAEEVVRRGGCLSLPGWIWKTLQMGQGVGGTV